jgi:RNA polymerase primary sigma factor
LDQYLRDVARHELLTREEEVEVARRARAGDREALQRLVQANLRFVISVAKRYRGRGLPFSDLIQQGNLGLLTAAMKFDPERGVKFISYAVWWIRQHIQAALAHHGLSVRLPVNRMAELSKIRRARETLREELDREPSHEEIAERVGLDPTTVEMLLALTAGELRIDAPVGEDDTSTLRERLVLEETSAAFSAAEDRFLRDDIEEAMQGLRERDAFVLRLYYGLGGEREHTLEEIGRVLGITRERVRQLRDRALRELREGRDAEALASYAGAGSGEGRSRPER